MTTAVSEVRDGGRTIALGPRERRAVQVLLATLFPSTSEGPPGADQLDLIPIFESVLAAMPRAHAVGLRAAFTLGALALPLACLGRGRPLWALDIESREECLRRLVKHRLYVLRQLGILLKAIGSLVYFQHPDVRAALHLPPAADPGESAQGLLA